MRFLAGLVLILNLGQILLGDPVNHKRFLFTKPSLKPPLAIQQPTYKAAVYNHKLVRPVHVKSRTEALAVMNKNLDIYEKQAAKAGSKGVDILVFPEDGLYGGAILQRINMYLFLESVPDPKEVIWNPCVEKNRFANTEVQHRLSCMARNNSLYIVANMGDVHHCSRASDTSCPLDGRYQYNTDVVFNPHGTLIVRYHKRNLFYETEFNYPPKAELATFDTPFGRFAVFTCFDSLFHDPSIEVIEDYNVDSVAFPTLWSERPPFFYAVQWQSAFSVGMKVNLLAANHNNAGGSGIYTPTGVAIYAGNHQPSQLLIATIHSRPNVFPSPQPKPTISATQSTGVYASLAFRDHYKFVNLREGSSSATVCNGRLCCQANYSFTQHGGDVFALGAFSGVHTAIARFGVQMCVVMKCVGWGTPSLPCGQTPHSSASTFSRLVLTGNFTTNYVFPEILVSSGGTEELASGEWQYSDKVLSSAHGFSKPLLSAVLLGRLYSAH
ncbi:pantetheinase-like [Liolophura sinensis]|uniref:pantetheinase-like n=1 Tax=Liolophura sinensis TaxID=3198878 RepID=UPI003158B299